MERMYQEFKDIAEFYIVYISEAHAADDRFPVGYAKELNIKEHKNFGERCAVATRLQRDKKLNIPCLIDNMDNAVADAYAGWPDRVYLVGKNGRLAVAGKRGPWGFKPAVTAAQAWLTKYKETGREPDIVVMDDDADYGGLQRQFMMAFGASDYAKAIKVGEKLHKAFPDDVGAMYNLACAHCLDGSKDKAYAWLEKAIAAGYRNAEHLAADEDFKSIRNEKRFQELLQRVRDRAQRVKGTAAPEDVKAVLGYWDMKTTLGENSIPATMTLSFEDGSLVGQWTSQGREMPMSDVNFDGSRLSFKRRIGEGMMLEYEGTVSGDKISGKYVGPFGELTSNGTRRSQS